MDEITSLLSPQSWWQGGERVLTLEHLWRPSSNWFESRFAWLNWWRFVVRCRSALSNSCKKALVITEITLLVSLRGWCLIDTFPSFCCCSIVYRKATHDWKNNNSLSFWDIKNPSCRLFLWSIRVFSQEGCRLGHAKVVATKWTAQNTWSYLEILAIWHPDDFFWVPSRLFGGPKFRRRFHIPKLARYIYEIIMIIVCNANVYKPAAALILE